MNQTALFPLSLLLLGVTACRTPTAGAAPASSSAPAAPTTGDHDMRFVSPPAAAEWTTPAGDPGNTRYSSLDRLNAANVKGLRVVAMVSTGVPHGHEGQPLVVKDTLYAVTPFPNDLIAIDLHDPTGPIKWRFQPHPDPTSVGKACCDTVNRGAAYADGKIVYNLLDANTVAVDAITGEEVWRTKVGEVNTGETTTMAPIIADGLVLVGNSGGELGVHGNLVALDLATGHEVWRGHNTGPDSQVLIGADYKPFYAWERGTDLGVKSWPPDQWKMGGGTVWGWVSYDPGLDLVYYGTGNPGTWNPDVRPGDNLFSCAIVARDRKTGHVRWAHQLVPHDSWDYDEIMENALADMPWHGSPRKLLVHPGRVGFVFVMDRETGEMLSAEKFMPVNWARGYDLKTGRPDVDPAKETHIGKVVHDICPSSTGAKEFAPSALSPRTGLLYIPAHNTCMEYEGAEANYIAGTPYLGAHVKMYPGAPEQGELVAWDVGQAARRFGVKEKFPLNGGVLATAGDLVFYGTMDGWFRAIDARTGARLWSLKLPSGIVGNPMTFLGPDGKQYVAVYSGVGGWMGATAFPDVSVDDPYAALGTVGAMKEIKKYTGAGDVLFVFGL